MMSDYDSLVKWAAMSVMYASLTVLAACAEDGMFGTAMQTNQNPQFAALPNDSLPPMIKPTRDLPQAGTMLGKDIAALEAELGQPSLLREEVGAQVWQYTDQVCVLLLYLYQSDDSIWRVTHAETRRKRGVRSLTDCTQSS